MDFIDETDKEAGVARLIDPQGRDRTVPMSVIPGGAGEGSNIVPLTGLKHAGEDTEAIRAHLYERLSADPNGPAAAQIRRILGKLQKIQVGRGMGQEGRLAGSGPPVVEGEPLQPTADEQAGIPFETQKAPLLGRAAAAASSLRDPHVRRQFERGADNMLTAGIGQKIAGLADKLVPTHRDTSEVVAGETAPVWSDEGHAIDRFHAPHAEQVGTLAAALSGRGFAGLAGRAGASLAGPIANAGKGIAGKLLTGGLGGVVANEVAAPVIAGGQAVVHGENPLPAMKDAATDPLNIGLGAAAGALGGLARGIRGGTGQTGRDIRLAEDHGATVTPFGGAKGGAYNDPSLAGKTGHPHDVGIAARHGARKVASGLENERDVLGIEYAAAKTNARAMGQMEGFVHSDAVIAEAKRLLGSERLTGGQKQTIQREVLDVLDRYREGMTVERFNEFREKLADMAAMGDRGENANPNKRALGNLFHAAKNAVDETEMGPINERYHKGMEGLRTKYDQLKSTPDTDRRVFEERVANMISRRGEAESRTEGIQDPAVEEFLSANPQYREAFDHAALLTAKERMSAGLTPHGGYFRRLKPHSLMEKNLEPAAVGAYRGLQLAEPALIRGARAAHSMEQQ